MKLTNKYINFILTEIALCLDALGYVEYKIHVNFKKEDSGDDRLMDVEVNKNYLEALLTVYPIINVLFKQNELRIIRETVVHELVHIMLWDLCELAEKSATKQNADDIETTIERTTERVARALVRPHDKLPEPDATYVSSANPQKIKRDNITFTTE